MAATFADTVQARLDEIESALPPLPARVLRFQRTLADDTCQRVNAALEAVTEAVKRFLETAAEAGRTFTDQARATGGDAATTIIDRVRSVLEQAQAQGRQVADNVVDTASGLVGDDKPGTGTPYEDWTKAELVERAKELSIVGPTRMSKAELIAALRAA